MGTAYGEHGFVKLLFGFEAGKPYFIYIILYYILYIYIYYIIIIIIMYPMYPMYPIKKYIIL